MSRLACRLRTRPVGCVGGGDTPGFPAGRSDAARRRSCLPQHRRGKVETAWRNHRQRVTSGPRLARCRSISGVGHVRHIGFGSETLGSLPRDSRSAERSGQFALGRDIKPSPSSKTTRSSGIGSVTTTSQSRLDRPASISRSHTGRGEAFRSGVSELPGEAGRRRARGRRRRTCILRHRLGERTAQFPESRP